MPIMSFKPRLVLRVIWNAEFSTLGKELARNVYSRLCRDVERPAFPRPRDATRLFPFGFNTPPRQSLPDALALDTAETTVVVVLLDTSIRADQAWRECVRNIEKQIAVQGRRHLFLPIACEDKVLTVVDKANCVRLYKFEPKEKSDRLVSAITHELARVLFGEAGRC